MRTSPKLTTEHSAARREWRAFVSALPITFFVDALRVEMARRRQPMRRGFGGPAASA